jgi:hypothetical protein
MAINQKSRSLYQPSRLTRDLGDKVGAFGLAQRFQGRQQPPGRRNGNGITQRAGWPLLPIADGV